ncbi:MAG: hypothetical protein R2724_22495 [Bryobacterales bacterium]
MSSSDRVFRRSLESADLYWIAGFPVAENDPRIVEEIVAYAAEWASEPRLLALSMDGDGTQEFCAAAEAAARVHEEHPGLLVTTTATSVRQIGAFDRSSQDVLQPDLDFWSLAAARPWRAPPGGAGGASEDYETAAGRLFRCGRL